MKYKTKIIGFSLLVFSNLSLAQSYFDFKYEDDFTYRAEASLKFKNYLDFDNIAKYYNGKMPKDLRCVMRNYGKGPIDIMLVSSSDKYGPIAEIIHGDGGSDEIHFKLEKTSNNVYSLNEHHATIVTSLQEDVDGVTQITCETPHNIL